MSLILVPNHLIREPPPLLYPLAQRLDEPIEPFAPLACAEACASGAIGGVMVSQKRTKSARVSVVIR
jgi:hypothetical protein